MRREPSDEALLAARIARSCPSLPSAYTCAALAAELCRYERALRRLAVRNCNGEVTDEATTEVVTKTLASIRTALLKWQIKCTVRAQGDPRGPVLLIRLPGEDEYATV